MKKNIQIFISARKSQKCANVLMESEFQNLRRNWMFRRKCKFNDTQCLCEINYTKNFPHNYENVSKNINERIWYNIITHNPLTTQIAKNCVMAVRILNKIIVRGHFVLIMFLLKLFLNKCNCSNIPTRSPENSLIKDSLMLSSADHEREAKELYDEALKNFGITGKTLKQICAPWELKGCLCSGSSEEVTLLCRGEQFYPVFSLK